MITITRNTKRVIKITLGVIILLLLFWYVGTNYRDSIITKLGGYTKQDIKTTIDTVSIKYDTVYPKYKELLTKVKELNERELVKNYIYKYYITEKQPDGSTILVPKTEQKEAVYVTNNAISDSLIDGNIRTVVDYQNSKIIEQELLYKPKFPIIVTKTITVEKVIEKTLSIEPKNRIGIGGRFNSDKNVGVIGVYQFKNNWQIQSDFNWNLDTRTDIDRPKNNIGISIIKLF